MAPLTCERREELAPLFLDESRRIFGLRKSGDYLSSRGEIYNEGFLGRKMPDFMESGNYASYKVQGMLCAAMYMLMRDKGYQPDDSEYLFGVGKYAAHMYRSTRNIRWLLVPSAFEESNFEK